MPFLSLGSEDLAHASHLHYAENVRAGFPSFALLCNRCRFVPRKVLTWQSESADGSSFPAMHGADSLARSDFRAEMASCLDVAGQLNKMLQAEARDLQQRGIPSSLPDSPLV